MDTNIRTNKLSHRLSYNSRHHSYYKQTIEIDGSSIRLFELKRESLTGKEPCIVFIHGLGSDTTDWEGLYNSILLGYRLFSIELPWSGQSSSSLWSSTRNSAEWLAEALKIIPCRVDSVVAHSFGAQSLLKYLEKFGDKAFASIVLLSPPFKGAEQINWEMMGSSIEAMQPLLAEGIRAKLKYKKSLTNDIVQAMAGKVKDRIGPQSWLQFFSLLATMDYADLSQITIPVQIMLGENEKTIFIEDCNRLKHKIKNSEVTVIKDCQHFAMIEKPNELGNLLNQFFSKTIPQST